MVSLAVRALADRLQMETEMFKIASLAWIMLGTTLAGKSSC
jgi:hypothetical protein